MSPSMIIFLSCVAAAVGAGLPAARYPPGVDPLVCPNYPYCDNTALAVGHHGALATYGAPVYSIYGHQAAIAHGAGAKYPAGVSPHTCPNYPYCGPTPAHPIASPYILGGVHHGVVRNGLSGAYAAPIRGYGVLAAHHGAGTRYPAAVDPNSCPNYPYCHH